MPILVNREDTRFTKANIFRTSRYAQFGDFQNWEHSENPRMTATVVFALRRCDVSTLRDYRREF